MKKRFQEGMMRYASGIGMALALLSWISPLLFFVLAASTQLNWWHPNWTPPVRKTLFLLLAVFSIANCFFYIAFIILTLRFKARLRREGKTTRRMFSFTTSIGVYVLLTSWAAAAQTGPPSLLLFWVILAVWGISGSGVIALEVRRLRRKTVQQQAQ